MRSRRMGIVAVFLCLSCWGRPGWAAGLGTSDAPTLRCVIKQCESAEDCRVPFKLGDVSLNTDTGSDFLFRVSDEWKVTPEHFRLDGRSYVGETYLSRTVLDIDIDRTTKALRLSVAVEGTGVTPRHAVSTGTCEALDTVPIAF